MSWSSGRARSQSEVQAMNIEELIGKNKDRLTRSGYDDSLAPGTFVSLGGQMWKRLRNSDKTQYLNLQDALTKDDTESDHRIGVVEAPDGQLDNSFQERLIGGVPQWIEKTAKYLTQAVKSAKFLDYPRTLVDDIEKSKSHYTYAELLQSLALYQNNEHVDKSRVSRYDKEGKAKVIPLSQTAKKLSYDYYDLMAYGIDIVSKMEPSKQHDILISGIVTSSNVGYPYFVQQSKDTFFKMWRRFLTEYLHLNMFKDVEFLTINEVISVTKYVHKNKLHFPYMLFYRTQTDKVRAVFGGHIVDKMLGALVHAGKTYGMTRENCERMKIATHNKDYDVDKNGELISENTKYFPTISDMPIIGQLPWEIMFKIIVDKLPPREKVLSSFVKEKYKVEVPEGEYIVDVIGEDFSRYDTTLIPEDLDFLRGHKKMGWLISFILDDMLYSEVWTGNLRVRDVYFKSGHPLTSELGTFAHLQRQFAYVEQYKKQFCQIIYACDLSDDSVWSIVTEKGFDFEDFAKWLSQYGLKIKPDASFSYYSSGIGIFLRTLFGDVREGEDLCVMGEPMSKYLGLCHSERAITPENVDKEPGVWNITGDVQVDMGLSKLASLGPYGAPLVVETLELTKDTRFGQKCMLAIHGMKKANRRYKLYREDVAVGLSDPAWLADLAVLEQMVRIKGE
jgi:hypothetical protein